MDDKQTNFENIERYLSGDLSSSETNAFNQRLAKDKVLQQELLLHKELQSSIQDRQSEVVERKINAIGQEFIQSKKEERKAAVIPLWKRPIAIAATLTFLIALSFLIRFYTADTFSAEQLYANNFNTPELLTISRSDNTEVPISLVKAYEAYETQQYTEAIIAFSDYAKIKELSIDNQYYNAICYLAKSPVDPQKAIDLLQAVILNDNNAYVDAARWYTAMAWLKKGDKDQAQTILEEIKNKGKGKYKLKAEELLTSGMD